MPGKKNSVIINSKGQQIKWTYVSKFYNIENNEGLRSETRNQIDKQT